MLGEFPGEMLRPASSSATFRPASAKRLAAQPPVAPEPTTSASYVSEACADCIVKGIIVPQMNRRELFRQTLLGAAAAAVTRGTGAAREFPPEFDASKELARADWKPAFLDDHQNETLAVFGDMLIPATDTPGAKAALANRFIDQVLAAETHETQKSFLESLAFLDGESFARYRAAFIHLTPEQQNELMTYMAYPHTLETGDENVAGAYRGHAHFSTLKDWVSRAYYSSPVGMQALGYHGSPGGVFEGCK